jgi:hypothetical protein
VPTRVVDIYEVADASGEVITSVPLEVGSTYAPARLNIQAVEQGANAGNDGNSPYFRIESAQGKGVAESWIGGWSSATETETRYGPGLPNLLDAGTYVLHAGRAIYTNGSFGPMTDECVRSITVAGVADITLEAGFPKNGPCEWREPTSDPSAF